MNATAQNLSTTQKNQVGLINKINSQSGFSLVELMVVVAIIGILASVAVPQFKKFQLRAKQSEAQAHLSGIYTAEVAFFAQWNTYYSGMDTIGYAPSGKIRYNCGWKNVGKPTTAKGVIGLAADSSIQDTAGLCTSGNNCSFATDVTQTAAGALSVTYGTDVTPTTFQASCETMFDGGNGSIDTWTIDQGKIVKMQIGGI